MDMNSELTDKEMDRIDRVQNLTYDYINKMLPRGKSVEFDLDTIDDVIEAVWDAIKDKGICTEMEFYPYREHEPESHVVEGDDVPDDYEDPSVDCYDFVWKYDECYEERSKCCECCANCNPKTGKCSLEEDFAR